MKLMSARLDDNTVREFERVLKKNRSAVVRELVEAGKKHKAVELYGRGKVSLGLGARLAGVTLSEFIDLLKEHNVELNLSLEDVRKEMSVAREVL